MSLLRKKNITAMLAPNSKESGLKKTLGPIDLILLGLGALVGTGIFVLTGTGALMAGPALAVSFIMSAVACGFVALAYAEFAASMPVTGSIYTYCYATLGEIVAWVVGWVLMLEYGLATSAVAVGWSGYLQSLLFSFGFTFPKEFGAAPGAIPGLQTIINLPAMAIVGVITGLLCIGIRESVRINNVMVVIKISVVILVIAVGIFHVKPGNWEPFMPFGWSGVSAAAAVIFFAFIGFDAVSSAAEEVRNPQRDLPIGILGSLILCVLLYVMIAIAMTGMVSYKSFAGVDNPISMALQAVNLNWIGTIVDVSAVIGMLTVMLVMAYGQTRIVFAMSRDGLLPTVFSVVNPKFSTPVRATLLNGLILGLLAGLVPLTVLAELVNIGTLTAFGAVSVAVIVLRRTFPDLHRPFNCPGMPYIPIAAFSCCLFLMTRLAWLTWIAYFCWISFGLLIYFCYSRFHSKLAENKL